MAISELNALFLRLLLAAQGLVKFAAAFHTHNAVESLILGGHQTAPGPQIYDQYLNAEIWSPVHVGDDRRSATDDNDDQWAQMEADDDQWSLDNERRKQLSLTHTDGGQWPVLDDSISNEAHRARRHAIDFQSRVDEQELSKNFLPEQLYFNQSETSGGELQRDSKLFFSLVQILPVRCSTQDNITRSGVCLSSTECTARTGVASGSCAQGLAVCCILQKTCLQSTNINNTFFVNPNYPEADEGAGACSLTVNRANDNICQMRVDFLRLELSQPDENGQCITDFLTVTGGITDAPIICGSNTGQHMYIDVDPNGGSVRLSVDRTAASVEDRIWNVKVAQIPCTSSFRAPRGCLQYFTQTSGTVQSFNFNQVIDEDAVPLATRQVSSMDYSACVQMAEGYCSIIWSRNLTAGDFGFTVSHAVDGVDPEIIGTPSASTRGVNCTTDYVVIPGGVDDTGLSTDRFCGHGFPNSVTSSMKPFLLFVRTDADELPDTLNRGFSLDYRQTIC
ncbi:CUB domain [Trinorchestia longiramus]|nr:CUB domain [Trinorchestia longiramus]